MKTFILLLTLIIPWFLHAKKSSKSLSQTSVATLPKEIYRNKVSVGGKSFYVVQLSDCKVSMVSGNEQNQCQLSIGIEDEKKISGLQKFGVPMVDVVALPLTEDKQKVQYSSGEEEAGTELRITSLKLSKDLRGLLITQIFGFDHVHREHFLFAVVDNKLKKVWGGNEGAGGPVSNNTDVFKIDDTTDGFYFQKASYFSDAELPDAWNIQFFKWNAETKKLEEIKNANQRPTVWAVIAGSFTSVKDAHEFKSQRSQCLQDFQNLSSNEYPKLQKDLQVIAFFSTDKSKVESSMASLKTCDPKIETYLKEVL